MLRWIMGIVVGVCLSSGGISQTYNTAPVDGIWWNPLESGRGWTFETQNNVTAILHFQFASDRRSTFFTSTGIWNGINRTITTPLIGVNGGQCIGCPYVAPTTSDLGAMSFVFTSTTRGSAIYPNGTTIPIQKFDFVYGDPRAYLKGQWASVWVSLSGSDFANFINFTTDCVTCTTPNSVEGRLMLNSASGRPVIGAPVSSGGIYLAIVDATTSFYDYYYINPDPNRWTGIACTASKTSPPPAITSCLGLLYASRSKTQAAAASAVEPNVAKSSLGEALRKAEINGQRKLESREELPLEYSRIDWNAVNSLLEDIRRVDSRR